MDISIDEARLVLDKWRIEKKLLLVLLGRGDVTLRACMRGAIAALSSEGILSFVGDGETVLQIDLHGVRASYGDRRDAFPLTGGDMKPSDVVSAS